MNDLLTYLSTKGIVLLENVVKAVVILIVGFYVAKWISKLCVKAMEKAKIEKTLITFLDSLIGYAIKLIVIFSALTTLGFPMGSLIAVLGTVGAALALGFKDSLGSFVSGVLILFTKPFVVGNFIEVAGQTGTVKEIEIMHTILLTPDNKHISIPNNQMTNTTIINYSKEANRRVDIVFGISYDSNVELAKNLILKAATNHALTLSDPEPFVRVTNYGASSIDITLRVWCENANYWAVNFDLLEQIKADFDKNGIQIPYDQVDVHIKQN